MADILKVTDDITIFSNDGTTPVEVNVSGELQTRDDDANTSLDSVKTSTDKINETVGIDESSINTLGMGLSDGEWLPNQATPDLTAGQTTPFMVETNGALRTRSLVLTDEGSFQDHFDGTELKDVWNSNIGSGGSVTVADSMMTMASGTTANSDTWITKELDYLPIRTDFLMRVTQRIANQEIWLGFCNTPDPNNATEYAWWRYEGTDYNTVYCETSSHAGTGGQEGVGVARTFPQEHLPGSTEFHTLSVACLTEMTYFSHGTNLAGKETMAVNERQIPGTYTPMYFVMRIKNGATPPASTTSLIVDNMRSMNLNRVDIAQRFSQDAAKVSLMGYDAVNTINRQVGVDTTGRLLISQANPQGQTVTVAYDKTETVSNSLTGFWYEVFEQTMPPGYKWTIGMMQFLAENATMTGRISKYIVGGTYEVGTSVFTDGTTYSTPGFASYLEAECLTVMGANQDIVVTITYTSNFQVAGRVATATVPKNTPAGWKVPFLLQGQDGGIADVTNVTHTGTNTGTLQINTGVTFVRQRCTSADTTYTIIPSSEALIIYPDETLVFDFTVSSGSTIRRRMAATGLLEKI